MSKFGTHCIILYCIVRGLRLAVSPHHRACCSLILIGYCSAVADLSTCNPLKPCSSDGQRLAGHAAVIQADSSQHPVTGVPLRPNAVLPQLASCFSCTSCKCFPETERFVLAESK